MVRMIHISPRIAVAKFDLDQAHKNQNRFLTIFDGLIHIPL